MKGVNFLTTLVEVGCMKLPVGVKFVKKDTWVIDVKTGKNKKNHFAMKAQIYLAAQKAAKAELAILSEPRSAA